MLHIRRRVAQARQPVSQRRHDVAQFLPSYWLVQASHVSIGGQAWGAKGWAVVVGWTIVLTALARAAYRRDTGRV